MKHKLFTIFFALILTQIISCKQLKVDVVYVKSDLWLWNKGFKVGEGDAIDFDTSNYFTISHDTIFRKGVPRCVIIETNKEKYIMTVKSFNGELGYYDASEQFTK